MCALRRRYSNPHCPPKVGHDKLSNHDRMRLFQMTKTPIKLENHRRIAALSVVHTPPGCYQLVSSGRRGRVLTGACTATISEGINGATKALATRAVSERSPAVLNPAQLDACSKPGSIACAAFQSAYAAKLTASGIDGAFVLLLQTDCGPARKQGGDAMQGTTGKESATATEAAAQKTQAKGGSTIQARARQKYFSTAPATLTDYYIGADRIDANRPTLEQVSQAITADVKTELADRRQDYLDINEVQGDAQNEATGVRNALTAMLKSITQRRMTIQFAADAEWPWHDPASAGQRKEFHLPTGGPFTG